MGVSGKLMYGTEVSLLHRLEGTLPLKVGYHTESRCQYQPASFSSAFKLSGTVCLVGVGGGSSLLRFGTCNERGHYLSPPSPPVALSFHTSTGSLDPFS